MGSVKMLLPPLLPLLPFLLLGQGVNGDTPANCTYQDVAGSWIFYESERSGTNKIDCSTGLTIVEKTRVTLSYPDVAVDQYGNKGTWTMVYNQGFEVTVTGRSYFAFSDFTVDGQVVTSFCNRTKPGEGWSHDVTVRNWACFSGRKVEKTPSQPKEYFSGEVNFAQKGSEPYSQSSELVDAINSLGSSWDATLYPQWEGVTRDQVTRIRGGLAAKLQHRPTAQEREDVRVSTFVPPAWDWRNVSGINYLSEVRNQGVCGSCYAFSSMGMLEARVRIATANTKQFTFSPQDVVSCSELAQGCDGGFPYLIAGRYGKDFGVVEEACSPYTGHTSACATKSCLRHYTADYRYVGGYYGGCSEEAMKEALVSRGPLSVSFEVYDDFMQYKSGIYYHTGLKASSGGPYIPLEVTNHAVLLVGYGTCPVTGHNYWTVKNSWGEGWGEGGFFRIRRGVDECAIESIAVEATVIP